mmetsp:Transcript_12680/g.54459  ORF Transcript_12680/g.54459 Transcript_12680/m.54459 type:complete len:229 (+) Transcript_12680:1238-1924(+)
MVRRAETPRRRVSVATRPHAHLTGGPSQGHRGSRGRGRGGAAPDLRPGVVGHAVRVGRVGGGGAEPGRLFPGGGRRDAREGSRGSMPAMGARDGYRGRRRHLRGGSRAARRLHRRHVARGERPRPSGARRVASAPERGGVRRGRGVAGRGRFRLPRDGDGGVGGARARYAGSGWCRSGSRRGAGGDRGGCVRDRARRGLARHGGVAAEQGGDVVVEVLVRREEPRGVA